MPCKYKAFVSQNKQKTKKNYELSQKNTYLTAIYVFSRYFLVLLRLNIQSLENAFRLTYININNMRNIPIATKNLLLINIIAYLAYEVLRHMGIDLNSTFGLHFILASNFSFYQLVTYMFMHGGISHLFFNMFALWMFGCVVERVWGTKKFLIYYFVCGIGAGLMQEAAQFVNYSLEYAQYSHVIINEMRTPMDVVLNSWTTVGASGAIYGILLAFGMIFPEERIFIFPLPIPIKAKWFVLFYVAIELFSAFSSQGDGVAHVAHLGGMLFGYILIRYWNRHPYYGGFGTSQGQQFFNRMRSNWERRSNHHSDNTGWNSRHSQTVHESDWDYNARKKEEQDEIDCILDKIRKSGYDSLTKEEKQKLFDKSRK